MNHCLKCDAPTTNWYCPLHYLEKEAAYAVYDITHNRQFVEQHKELTLNRLFSYAEFLAHVSAL